MFSYDENNPLIFTQFNFWAFFALVMIVFSLVHNRKLLRNTFLFFASLFFYYQTSGLFVLILLFSTFSDFYLGKLIYSSQREIKRKIFVSLSVVINLGTLIYFKYAYFFTDAFNKVVHTDSKVFNHFAHWSNSFFSTDFAVDKIMLPVGISFYTFQTISYSVDVYRRKIKPVTNIFDFGFYVSFFPQLVAGPIVRASEFVPQLYKKYFISKKMFGLAVFWILNGLAKKLILGDYLAVNFIDRVFENPLLYSGFENVMAIFGYSLQVYADFSGYTDIAIGVALLMGFQLPVNFNSPYKATNPSAFWKRWHISLSSWLKDYLYIPLGGNRNASLGTYLWTSVIALIIILLSNSLWVSILVPGILMAIFLIGYFLPNARKNIITNINLMITMLLGGIWHGASWNFMIWGGLNGGGIVVYKYWREMSQLSKLILTFLIFIILFFWAQIKPLPLLNIGVIWIGMIWFGELIKWGYSKSSFTYQFNWTQKAWAILLTFVFITFTRIFFRAGSNLDPAESNRIAWETASNIVRQIGGKWNTTIIDEILIQYKNIFLIFAMGMLIHWLPIRIKKWYRINFILFPRYVQLVVVILSIFVIYQFVTADLQTFIYFQF
jgi:D-alanyl-lipoteichoic acid acyltransferase DltB (MBOAT superfamily)